MIGQEHSHIVLPDHTRISLLIICHLQHESQLRKWRSQISGQPTVNHVKQPTNEIISPINRRDILKNNC